MRSFEFKNKNLEVNINGTIYTIYITDNLGDTMQDFSKKMSAMSDDIKKKKKNNIDAIKMLKGIIDNLLGENAFDNIFKDREETKIMDCTDLFMFLVDEIKEFNAK